MAGKPRTANKLQFLPPKKIVIAILKSTGQFSQEYPTFLLSYMSMPIDSTPDDQTLSDIQAFQINFDPQDMKEANLEIVAFTQPREELLDFADSYFIHCEVDTKGTNAIMLKIQQLGRYVIMINTEFYTYRALVEDETGEVLEAAIDYRMVN